MVINVAHRTRCRRPRAHRCVDGRCSLVLIVASMAGAVSWPPFRSGDRREPRVPGRRRRFGVL